MGFTTVTAAYQWWNRSIFIEIYDAINERQNAFDGLYTPLTVPATGALTGSAAEVAALQAAIEELVGAFLDHVNHPGTWDGASAIDADLWSFPGWAAASGLTEAGYWRRVPTWTAETVAYDSPFNETTILGLGSPFSADMVGLSVEFTDANRGSFEIVAYISASFIKVAGDATGGTGSMRFSIIPDDWSDYSDPAFFYGTALPGDVAGLWLPQDMQAGLLKLLWTLHAGTPAIAGDLYEGRGEGVSEAAAYAAASADWARTDDAPPYSPYRLAYVTQYADYWCNLYRTRTKFQFATDSTQNRDIDWYLRLGSEERDTYVSDGDDGGEGDGNYNLYDSDAGVSDEDPACATYCGAVTVPPQPALDEATGYNQGADTQIGMAVVKWNVVGGFTYQ